MPCAGATGSSPRPGRSVRSRPAASSPTRTLHRQHAPALARALAEDRGYPLQVDATGGGRGALFVTYGSCHWVLGAWKLPAECANAILPHLQGVVQGFGVPCAVVRDIRRVVTAAVTAALARPLRAGLLLPCRIRSMSATDFG